MRTRSELPETRLVTLRPRQLRIDVTTISTASAADARFSEHEVRDYSDHGEHDDDDDPREPRCRFTMGPKQCADKHRCVSEDQSHFGKRREGERKRQPLLSPVKYMERPPNRPPPSHL